MQAAVRLCQAGDISGLETLYSLYGERVFRTCFRILGDRAAAEDQTHDVFLRVFQKIGRFRGRSTFSTWLFRLTVNQTLNRHRGRKRRRRRMSSPDVLEDLAADGPAPDRQALRHEQSDAVQEMLSRVSVDHRVVLTLREIDGLSYAEISEVLGIPRGTVMSRLHRARRELRSLVAKRNIETDRGVQNQREVDIGD